MARRRGIWLPYLAELRGVRFITIAETQDAEINQHKLQYLTGQNKIMGRRKYGRLAEFRPEAKLFLEFNRRPRVGGTAQDLVRVIPFDVEIAEADRDRDLFGKLAGEAPGILNWAVKGCLAWRDGLGKLQESDVPTVVDGSNHPLWIFLRERCALAGVV